MRIGLVGAGRIGALRAATLLGLPEAPEVIVTDTLTSRGERVAAELGCGFTPTLAGLLEMRLDGVVIASGTNSHASLVRRSIAAGLPTFCEKPVAATLAETAELARLQVASGVPVHIGFQRRFDHGYRRARDAVLGGELGVIHQIRCATHDETPPSDAFILTSGGIFRDVSVNDFDAIRFVTGREVAGVYATGSTKGGRIFRAAGDLSTGVTVLTLDDGTMALVSAARHNGGGHDVRLEVHGSEGSLVVGLDDSYAFRSAEDGVAFPAGPVHHNFGQRFVDAYVAELSAFLALVRGEIDSPCTIADGLEAFRIAEACELSRSEGRPVTMAEVPGAYS